MTSVVVIGSGMAGLGAAYRLKQSGAEVTVLEAEAEVGGRVRSRQWNNTWIDLGAEFFAGIDVQHFEEVIKTLDLTDQMITYPGGGVAFTVWRDGKAYPLSFSEMTSFFKFGAMAVSSRLGLLRLLPVMIQQMRRNGSEHYQPWRAAWCDDESLEEWLNRLNPEFLEYAIEPSFELYFGYEPHDIGKAIFAYLMTQYSQAALTTFKEGLGQFTRKLGDWVKVVTNARVTCVTVGDKPTVQYEVAGKQQQLTPDYVVVAVPGTKVLNLMDGLDPQRQEFFGKVRYTPHELHFYKLQQDPPDVPEKMYFPRREDDVLSSLGYTGTSTNPDVKLFRPDLKTQRVRELLSKSDEENHDYTLKAVGKYHPQVPPLVTDSFISRWKDAIPVFGTGYVTALGQFFALPPLAGVEFAGDYLAGPSTGAAFVSGQRAAERLLQRSK